MTKRPSVGQIITESVYQYVLWSSRIIEKLPRNCKLTIGDKLHFQCLRTLELIIEATFTKDRSHLLRAAKLSIEQQRFLWRLSHDFAVVRADSYEFASRSLNDIGRSVGGWKKAHDAIAAQRSVSADSEFRSASISGAEGDPGQAQKARRGGVPLRTILPTRLPSRRSDEIPGRRMLCVGIAPSVTLPSGRVAPPPHSRWRTPTNGLRYRLMVVIPGGAQRRPGTHASTFGFAVKWVPDNGLP